MRAQRLGGVVEGEAEENPPEVVRRERLKDGREESAKNERNGETFSLSPEATKIRRDTSHSIRKVGPGIEPGKKRLRRSCETYKCCSLC